MVRRYVPSILLIPIHAVSQEPISVYIYREATATRAFERVMNSKVPNTINTYQLPTETQEFYTIIVRNIMSGMNGFR